MRSVSPFASFTLSLAVLSLINCFPPGSAQADVSAQSDPVQTYMEFHDKLPSACKLDELSKYFSRSRWAQMSKDEQKMPKGQFDLTFALFKKLSPPKVALVSQSLIGDVCILSLKSDVGSALAGLLDGGSGSGTGTVTMRKEEGQWKIEMEEWQASEIIGAAEEKTTGGDSTDGAGGAK